MDRYEEIHNLVNSKFNIIDNISDEAFKVSCLFSLLECFAQEYGNYPKGNNTRTFCEFLESFINANDNTDLNSIDPVTLYYSCVTLQSNHNLNHLTDGLEYTLSGMQNECQTILTACNNCINIQDCQIRRRHSYNTLLYKYRSKLSHEMKPPAHIFEHMQKNNEVFYYHLCDLLNPSDIGVWCLVFPYQYIKNLFSKAIASYIEDCKNNSCDPFKNRKINKGKFITWEY